MWLSNLSAMPYRNSLSISIIGFLKFLHVREVSLLRFILSEHYSTKKYARRYESSVITLDDGTRPAVTQAAGHRLLTAEKGDLSPVTSYEIRGGRSGSGAVFSQSFFSLAPAIIFPPLLPNNV